MSKSFRLGLSMLLLAPAAWAQFGSGFQGTITDRTGGVVPGVAVRVTNAGTGVTREVVSSIDGAYVVPSLSPGTYRIQALKTGFVSAAQDSLVLPPDEMRKVDFILQVGNVSETIDVTGQATVLETEVGRVTSQLNQASLSELPVPNNNLFNLMTLQPGVSGRSLSVDNISGRSTAGVNFAGARTDSNSYSMDNMTANSVSRGGASEITPNLESVEQVAVSTSNAPASEGRNMGAHVNIVSKAGTNQFHGSAWDYFNNNTLNTRNFFDTTGTSLPARRNQFGYAVGGPIIRNRTFFFTSYEGIRSSGSSTVSSTVETKEFVDYVMQTRPNSLAAKLYAKLPPTAYPTSNFLDLGSATPYAGPCGGCAAANIWNKTPDGIFDVGTSRYTRKSSSVSDQMTLRVDHELRPGKDRLYGYYYHFTGVSKTPPLRDSEVDNPTTGNFANLNETHIFSPSVLNEIQFGVVRYIGIYSTPPHLDVPVINITSGAGSFQDTNPYPGGWFPTEYVVKDSMSVIRGRHTIKFGGERRRNDNNLKHTASYIPNYSFASPLTFINDTALSMSRTVNPVTGQPTVTYASQRITEYGAYLQDDWKMRRNLTLNLGLRYEYFGPYTDAKDRLSNFIPGPGTGVQQIATGSGQHVQESWSPNHLDFGPRMGFAWDVGGKGKNVIRGGVGLSYDRFATVYPAGYRNNPPLIGIVTAGTQYGTNFTYSLGDLSKPQYLGYPVDASLATGLNSQNGIIGQRLSLIGVTEHMRQPYTTNWFFGIQRALPGKIVVEADYLGSGGRHLVHIANINRFAGDLLSGGLFHGFNQSFSSINMLDTGGTSNYHGGTFTARRTLSHGIMFQASYTYSKVTDQSEDEQGVTSFTDVNNRALDRGLASFNVPQRFSFNGYWDLPFLNTCRAWYCKVAGGWQIAGYGIFDDGMPFSVTSSGAYPNGDYNADGTTGDRPNAPLTPIQTSGFTRQQLLVDGIFKVSQFPVPALGTNGTLGRNTFQGPGFGRVDMAFTKIFRVTERFNLRFRMEAYNALNHTNLSSPSSVLTSNTFGKVTSSSISRQLRASLLLRF